MTLIRYLVAGTYLLALAAPGTAFAQERPLNLYITRITIRDKELTATSQIYAKNSCQTPTVQVNFKGELVHEESDGDLARIEYAVRSITTTPRTLSTVIMTILLIRQGAG
ncbi:hypothetical protein [Rhizobium herbae]